MNDLGARLAKGDRAAFAELYDAWADRLYHYVVVRLGSDDAAREVVQETFVRLARSRERLRKVDNLAAYMFQVARNESLRFEGGRRREAARREIAELVSLVLGRLPPDKRELVELKMYSGLTFREIADVTGLPQGTVATRYRAAISRLRVWMAKEIS